ncbi:MAG: enoyl-CoA hydratase/isomerase family protein [Candidatus Zixiibacteriota bacterium]
MSFISLELKNNIAVLTLNRGKVNAINETVLDEFNNLLDKIEKDEAIRAVILTGSGKFFSFGFDIPELIQLTKSDFKRYLIKFTNLYTRLFLFSKPVISALNGHTIAGGCMIASATDYRVMVTGKAKFSLNEITFGASVFTGSVELMKYCTGNKNAESILLSGKMFTAEEGFEGGFINQISDEKTILTDAFKIAEVFSQKDAISYSSIKKLLREPIVASYKNYEEKSIDEFIEIWYSDSTMEQLKRIKIHS